MAKAFVYWCPQEELWIARGQNPETKSVEVLMRSVSPDFAKDVILKGKNVLANKFSIDQITTLDKSLTWDATNNTPVNVNLAEQKAKMACRSDPDFSVNVRFEILETYVQMVGNKKMPSSIISGNGGLGKTHTVLDVLQNVCKLPDITEFVSECADQGFVPGSETPGYVHIKGYSTPKGIYETLYFNRDRIVVFDDCDKALVDKDAINVLKSALDSYEVRRVSWNTTSERETQIPRSFIFTGGVIFITNKSIDKISGPLKTRSYCADVTMSNHEILERMEFLAGKESFLPNKDREHIQDALGLIRAFINHERVRNLSLRTLIQVTNLRSGVEDVNSPLWQRAAFHAMVHGSTDE